LAEATSGSSAGSTWIRSHASSQVRNGQGPVRIRRQSEDSSLHNCGLLHAAPFTGGTAYEDEAIRVEVMPPLRSRTFHVLVTRK
jgi:hypothetical protein